MGREGCHRSSFFCSRRLWCRRCPPQWPNSIVRGRFDATNRPKTIFKAIWWTKGITKARLDKKPNQNHRHPRRSVSFERGSRYADAHMGKMIPDRLTPSGMTALRGGLTPAPTPFAPRGKDLRGFALCLAKASRGAGARRVRHLKWARLTDWPEYDANRAPRLIRLCA